MKMIGKIEVKEVGGIWRVLIGGKIYKSFNEKSDAIAEANSIVADREWSKSNRD